MNKIGEKIKIFAVLVLIIISLNFFFNFQENRCPKGYILAKGNLDFNQNNFCVMKYEAKKFNSIPISTNLEKPWINISQIEARIKCEELGKNFHLITNSEWMSLARDIELNNKNWENGKIGKTTLARGWIANSKYGDNWTVKGFAPKTNENCKFNTINDSCSSQGFVEFRRTFYLSNNEEIWDLSGNVYEWNNDTFESNLLSSLNKNESRWYNWSEIDGFEELKPKLNLTVKNGIGKVFATPQNAKIGKGPERKGEKHAFIRGGDFGDGDFGGIYSLSLNSAPTRKSPFVGFRCSKSI